METNVIYAVVYSVPDMQTNPRAFDKKKNSGFSISQKFVISETRLK